MELTLAESVLLLALDETKGSTGSTPINPGLAGALLVDLGRLGALQPVGKQLHPVEGVGIEHPVLARATAAITASSKPRTAKAWVGRLPRELKPLTGTVARPLVDCGILTEQQIKVRRWNWWIGSWSDINAGRRASAPRGSRAARCPTWCATSRRRRRPQ